MEMAGAAENVDYLMEKDDTVEFDFKSYFPSKLVNLLKDVQSYSYPLLVQ
jgi:hypothetical protein